MLNNLKAPLLNRDMATVRTSIKQRAALAGRPPNVYCN